jgi:hypothetical protein
MEYTELMESGIKTKTTHGSDEQPPHNFGDFSHPYPKFDHFSQRNQKSVAEKHPKTTVTYCFYFLFSKNRAIIDTGCSAIVALRTGAKLPTIWWLCAGVNRATRLHTRRRQLEDSN